MSRQVHYLQILLTVHRVVFIGFSLNDADFMHILRCLCAQLSLNDPRHFAILPRPDASEIAAIRAELRAKYIEPIFYDPADDHAALPILIEQLLEATESTNDAANNALTVDSVSTLVGELLADHPEAREAALQRIPSALAGQVGGLRVIGESLGDPTNKVDAEIDAVFKYVDQGLPEVAIEQYAAIQNKYAGSLTPRLQYRLKANIGTALYASGDDKGAADSYLQATAIYQESSAARGIEVLGHYLRGDTVKAHELAVSLCDDDPEFGRGQSLRVRSTPDDVPFAKVEDSVPESIRGDAEVALALADVASRRAAELLDEECSWLDRREVAHLAQDLGLYQEAFAIWRELLTAVRWNEDVMSLLRCAYFAGEEKFILDFCESARANGVREHGMLELEVEILMRWRELDRAVALLQEWLEHNPEDKDVRLTLSLIAVQAGLPELFEGDPRRLPSVEEVQTAARGAACAHVLRRSEQPEAGAHYAYSLYRRFPDEPVSRVALVRSVLDPTAPPIKLENPTTAGADAAVLVERDGEPARWIVVETGDAPSIARSEYSPSHALAVAIAGRVPGDTVEYQGRDYSIRALKNKVLHRVHQIMEHFEEDFPQEAFLRKFRLPEDVPEDAPIQEKLGEIWDQLQSFDERRRQTENIYSEYLMPLAMVAERLGRSLLETVRHFAASPTLDVRASLGDDRTWNTAVKSCGRGTELVLDAVGLATVQMLGLHEYLPEFGLRLVVPRSVLDELRGASLNAAGGKQLGYMGVVDGRFFIEEVTSEQIATDVERIESLVGFIQSECEVVGGAALLAVAEPLRTDLCKVTGIACADAIAIAKERAALLWTDDVAIAAVAAQQELQVRSAWTQTILFRAMTDGAISIDTYIQCLARLLVARYSFTRIASRDIAALMMRAEWKADSPVGEAIADLIGKVGMAGTHNEMVSIAGLALLWFTAPDEQIGREVVIGLLERIQPPATRFHLARRIYRAHGLPVDRLKLRRLKRLLRHWRSGDGPFKPRSGHRAKKERKRCQDELFE